MEKSSGSDWGGWRWGGGCKGGLGRGGGGQRRRREGMKLRWVFSPPCQEQPVFSPLWVTVPAVLDEWVTLQSDIRPGTDFWEKTHTHTFRVLGCWEVVGGWGEREVFRTRHPKLCRRQRRRAEVSEPLGLKVLVSCFLSSGCHAWKIEMLRECVQIIGAFACDRGEHMLTCFQVF